MKKANKKVSEQDHEMITNVKICKENISKNIASLWLILSMLRAILLPFNATEKKLSNYTETH